MTVEIQGYPRLVRVSDVARQLCISRSKVYLLMDGGDLPFVRIGRSRRVKLEDVAQLIETGTVRQN